MGERCSGGAACGRRAGRSEQGVRPRNLRAGAGRQRRQHPLRLNCQPGFSPRELPSERTRRPHLLLSRSICRGLVYVGRGAWLRGLVALATTLFIAPCSWDGLARFWWG